MSTLECLDIENWRVATKDEVVAYVSAKPGDRPESSMLVIRTRLRPVDVYTYLVARFGQPNGFQNFLRKNDSDNWIHWDFNLKAGAIDVYFAGASREIHIFIAEKMSDADWASFLGTVKRDFARVAKAKSSVLKELEKYYVFQNKFVALSGVCADLHATIVDTAPRESLPTRSSAYADDPAAFKETMKRIGERADQIFASCLQLRLLTPIMAEAFVNMIILMFCKNETRDDPVAYQGLLRAKVPERLNALSEKCHGFLSPVDTKTEAYKVFMRVIQKRNFALHGNVDPVREQIETVYFDGRRPLFDEPGHNVAKFFDHLEALNEPDEVVAEYEGVHEFLVEIRDCMDERTRRFFDQVISDAYPGWWVQKRRVTRILPENVIAGFMQGMRYDDELELSSGRVTEAG